MTITKAADELRGLWKDAPWFVSVTTVGDYIEVGVSSLVNAEHAFAPHKYSGYAVKYVKVKGPTR